MQISVRTSSGAVAVIGWILLSALAALIFWGARDRARLIRDNDNERMLNILFASLRNYDDFGSAIEASAVLKNNIVGFAIYGFDLNPVYSWGKVPETFDESPLKKNSDAGRSRYTVPDQSGRTVKFILNMERMAPPPPQGGHGAQRHAPPGRSGLLFNSMSNGKYYYIDIYHPDYWRTEEIIRILQPLTMAALFILVFYIRRLFLKNIEYREHIEAQRNLVVLGTAASTLAHEIKNPLLSIRIQTGILKKICASKGDTEINIIEQEVDRLSALTYRVNDYLREAKGNPVPMDAGELLRETFRRILGRDPDGISGKDCSIFMDTERARSVLENIIRNAQESGGGGEGISADISAHGGNVVISILDRGKGIPDADKKRIFDPFFTSKSTGTGIGLSISKRFIEAAEGSISVFDREGGGTIVRIVLPEYRP
ncbi:sensor histidine kinase [Treponema sp. OttesenSCG-928-L16]|nr:sensor histidine kinase [Treponema sp. OttesenSCG-928-L16]